MKTWKNGLEKKTSPKSIVKNVMRYLAQDKNMMITIQDIHLVLHANLVR